MSTAASRWWPRSARAWLAAIVIASVLAVGGTALYRTTTADSEDDPAASTETSTGTSTATDSEADTDTEAAEAETTQIAIGETAPDFTLDTPDGVFRLSDVRGEIVLVNFWATWCGPCRFEMPEFQQLHATRGADEGIRVVAVNLTSADTRAAAVQFAQDMGLTFTIAFDDDGAVAASYGAHSLPATFFVDREGVVRARSYGPVLGERLDAALRDAQAGSATP